MKVYGGEQAGMYYFLNDHLGTPQKVVEQSAESASTLKPMCQPRFGNILVFK